LGGYLSRVSEPSPFTRLRRFISALAGDLAEGELLTYASAMAFRVLFASIPFALFTFALIGFLDLTPAWTVGIAPSLRPSLPDPAFLLLDGTIRQALLTRQGFWLTLGFLLAIWQMSSTVRVTADALDRIYGIDDQRTMRRWLGTSIAVALAAGACLLAAAVAIYLGSQIIEWLLGPSLLASIAGFVLRWGLALAAMLLAVGLVLRYAPGERVRWRWVGTGAVATVATWGLATAAFGAYVGWLIDYPSLFGSLAFPFVLLFYLNFAALAFLVGVWVERRRHTGVERPLQVASTDTADEA
jgi:membrane protein